MRKQTIAILVFFIAGYLMAQTASAPDPASVERSFLEWYKTAPKTDTPPFDAYCAKLISDGATPQEADQVRALLAKLRVSRPALAEIVFDYTYSRPIFSFNTKPLTLLVETIGSLPPGKALDVCMGQGRNSVFLAQMGWQVTGFDVSSEGLKVARASAQEAGVQLNAIQATSDAFDYGQDQWDLILLSYAFGPFQDPSYIAKLEASLRKRGIVIWEHYSSDESTAAEGSRGEPNSLIRIFAGFRILRYEYTMGDADWGAQGQKSRLARLVAQKM